MNLDLRSRELTIALDAVREAAVMAHAVQGEIGAQAALKEDRSPVTIADFAVQALIAHRLATAFPDDPLVAEEDSRHLRAEAGQPTLAAVIEALARAGCLSAADRVVAAIDRGAGAPASRFWTLDPIDGTLGFLRRGQYVVALALVVDGRVEVGILACPNLPLGGSGEPGGAIVSGVRAGGAWHAPLAGGPSARLHVSSVQEAREARVLRSFESGHLDLGAFDRIVRRLGVETAPVLMDSQAKHAVIAAGGADLLLRLPAQPAYEEKIWDQAAGTLLIEEAGGRVTDLQGRPLDFGAGRWLARNRGVVASNGRLHDVVLEAIAAGG